MKKILALLLSLLMILALVPLGVCVAAEDTAVITVGSDIATPGSTVGVDISVKNNPGIMAMAFCLEYDSEVFEYVDYTQGYLTNYTVTNHSDKGIVSFVNIEERSVMTDGKIVTFNFQIKTTAPNGKYDFVIKNNNPDKYGTDLHNSFANASEHYVTVSAVAGTITVDGDYVTKMGDINNDGKINNKDLTLLMQHINKWDVTINEDAADVVVDGKINNKDYTLLMQYINKWPVELG